MLAHLELSWATLVALGGHGTHLGLIFESHLTPLWVPLDISLRPLDIRIPRFSELPPVPLQRYLSRLIADRLRFELKI